MRVLLFLLATTLPAFAQNTVYIDQVGNNNTVVINQNAQASSATVTTKGDWNEYNVTQQGIGTHSSSITQTYSMSSNNNNYFFIDQKGAGNHTANITMSNPTANNTNNVSITQEGTSGANKTFNLTLNGTGIGVNVVQNNLVVPDVGSMTITCLTPPCSGYSYIKN